MRLIPTEEMKELRDKVDPYLVVDGINVTLSKNAPEEIVEMHKRLKELRKQQYEEAGIPA